MKSTQLTAHCSRADISNHALRKKQIGVNKEKNLQLESGSNELKIKIRLNRILTTRNKKILKIF